MIDRPQVFGDDYIPDIVCREAEKTVLEDALRPITRGEPSHNCLLHGPTGVGKTATTRYMLAELERAGGLFKSAYISCLSTDDRRGILESAIQPLITNPERVKSLSQSQLIDEFRGVVTDPYVVVLDEADHLGGSAQWALYDLYETPQVSVVMVVNDRTAFLGRLGDKVHSRFEYAREIQFDSYTEQELARIVEQRAKAGLQHGAVGSRAIRTIAGVADHARSAVQILQTAAASTMGGTMTPEDVVTAVPNAHETLRDRALSRLGERHRYVFDILDDSGPLGVSAIGERYEEVTGREESRSTLYRVLSKLEEYDCVIADGEKSGREYRIREIPGGVPEIPV